MVRQVIMWGCAYRSSYSITVLPKSQIYADFTCISSSISQNRALNSFVRPICQIWHHKYVNYAQIGLIQIPLGHMSAGLVLQNDKVWMGRANYQALERENEADSDPCLILLVKCTRQNWSGLAKGASGHPARTISEQPPKIRYLGKTYCLNQRGLLQGYRHMMYLPR